MIYLFLLPVFFLIMLLYFRIADRYSIIDTPNERSSHSRVTIRGGGIIFLVAAAIAGIMNNDYLMPVAGIFIIGIVSFVDDWKGLSAKTRILFQLIAVTFLFIYLHIFVVWPLYVSAILYILAIGIINAYNFMDGINGMTGLYSLVLLLGLQYINLRQIHFIDVSLIWLPTLACLVFLFFNFRKRAHCFAGDVGSVTMAFWIILLLSTLILATGNWVYLLFLSVYGVDTVLTIVHRLLLKQNIAKAHRLHFYQLLVNEQGIPHLRVSSFYAFAQLTIIAWIIKNPDSGLINIAVALIPLVIIYVVIKPHIMNKEK